MGGKKLTDPTGLRYGRWKVLGTTARREFWRCRCDCGVEKDVQYGGLRNGRSMSCGCYHKEVAVFKHGRGSNSDADPTYRSWLAMTRRCLIADDIDYHRYGGKGITICTQWQYDFAQFLADMGERPDGTTLDRWPNKAGNYEPGNCRWATPKEQASNRAPRPSGLSRNRRA